ncbi:hypothetical protein ABK046_09395 [Streptomyces caeruleatus]
MLKRDGRVMCPRWRRNPLRRGSDIAEAWIGVAGAALLLVAAPAVGVATAGVAEHAALDQGRGLHRVTARLLEDAPPVPAQFTETATGSQVRAAVRWTAPDGSTRSGTASVAAGGRAGSPTSVWLDDAGRLRRTPPTPTQAEAQGAAFGAAAGVGSAMLVVGSWWIARQRLDRRRGMQWDRAWAEFDARRGQPHT